MYQDNLLPACHRLDGHEVVFISDVFIYRDGEIVEAQEEDRYLENGVRLIRVKYDRILSSFITSKIQKVNKLKILISEIEPDIILYHGICGKEIMTAAQYVKANPDVLFYADSHEDFNNTARSRIAKLAYKYIHGGFVRNALPFIKKILYISEETKEYLEEMYHIPEEQMEWFPLGGRLFTEKERRASRAKVVSDLGLRNDCIILGHSGKLVPAKKTLELIRAFSCLSDERLRLLIFGSLAKVNGEELKEAIDKDERILFLGWKQGQEINELLLACDLYCQPGTQSATLQAAVCCGCAIMIYPYPSYKDFIDGNGYFVRNQDDIRQALEEITESSERISSMRAKSFEIAEKYFDYKKIAARIYK